MRKNFNRKIKNNTKNNPVTPNFADNNNEYELNYQKFKNNESFYQLDKNIEEKASNDLSLDSSLSFFDKAPKPLVAITKIENILSDELMK